MRSFGVWFVYEIRRYKSSRNSIEAGMPTGCLTKSAN
jgi:hypothetical protein